ncbi:BCD family MFS transporter [Chlorobium sp. KB01]|uniref:BCD family MFS transporter n=1 Tax=Chlorobium sp. KB01 TaxID=1917528 RepID=UPI0009F95B5A|nr:BCD family MFS transporter [Chlorobium sp. KB01]
MKIVKTLNLVRLSMFQMGLGLMLGFIQDILNRVMIKELLLPATIALGLISLKELLAIFGVKVWIGNLSDRLSVFGYHRTPYILLGLLSCIVAFVLAPTAAYEVKIGGTAFSEMLPALLTDAGLWKLALIFLMFGFGLQVATTSYYALIADVVPEEHIGKVTGASWTLMVLTAIISNWNIGNYLTVYTPERLTEMAEIGGFITLFFGLVAILGVEGRNAEASGGKGKHSISFAQSVRLLSSSPKTLQFALYIFISIFALFANEVVMDPFGAEVFGMPVSATTKLFKPMMGGTQLIFMVITGFLLSRIGFKRGAYFGNTFSAIGFAVIIAAGFMQDQTLLRVGLVVTGMGLGAASVSNISMMMNMTAGRSGIYIGLWGTAQSLAIFIGHSGAGVIRDVIYTLSGNHMFAYAAIFMIEIIAFTASSVVLPHISKEAFEAESEAKMSEFASTAKAG